MRKLGPKSFTSAADVPDDVRKAAIELVAQALREQTPLYNVTLHDLTYDGQPIGSYEVSVRKID